jgi:hypothetical protein
MSLCIWTSLHLNLPEHKKEHLQKYRKLGWMILGLIAPEMVVWNAWEQRKQMKGLSKAMQERGFMPVRPKLWKRVYKGLVKAWHWTLTSLLLRAEDLPELAEPTPYRPYGGRIHPWTDVHSWFVVMGGLSFEDSAQEDQQFMPENRQRINITVSDFYCLLESRENLIPDISREYILDKSKSDRLAKLLTCWQAGYFCIQCISRLAQELSITLLELNVFAHALCALALFVIWSDKPRDVCEPNLIVGEEAMDVCALLCLGAVVSNPKNCFYRYRVEENLDVGRPLKLELDRPTSLVYDRDSRRFAYLTGFESAHYFEVLEIPWSVSSYWTPSYRTPFYRISSKQTITITIDLRNIKRLQRASRMHMQAFVSGKYICEPILHHRLQSLHSFARTKNWTLDISSYIGFGRNDGKHERFAWLAAGMTIAGICYGGLHVVAWKTPFASRPEALLWRASCVSIMAAGPSIALVSVLGLGHSYYEKLKVKHYRRPHGTRIWTRIKPWVLFFPAVIYEVSIFLCLGCPPLWYLFCRVFIIVESFIMLAHISDQALQVSTWSAYVPHIV